MGLKSGVSAGKDSVFKAFFCLKLNGEGYPVNEIQGI